MRKQLGALILAFLLAGCAGPTLQDGPGRTVSAGDQQLAQMTARYAELYAFLEKKVPATAKRYLGIPYRYGTNPDKGDGTDCSNLVCAVTRNSLTDTPFQFQPYYLPTSDITEQTVQIPQAWVRPGDLVIFKTDRIGSESHSGVITRVRDDVIFFVHASSEVGVQELSTRSEGWKRYWRSRLHSFRRWKPDLFIVDRR